MGTRQLGGSGVEGVGNSVTQEVGRRRSGEQEKSGVKKVGSYRNREMKRSEDEKVRS